MLHRTLDILKKSFKLPKENEYSDNGIIFFLFIKGHNSRL
jgi:hypothetical protein